MTFSSSMQDGVCVFRIGGEVTRSRGLKWFAEAVQEQIDNGVRTFVLDCAEVLVVWGGGASLFTQTIDQVAKCGGAVALSNADFLSSFVERYELENVLPLYPTIDAAIAALSKA